MLPCKVLKDGITLTVIFLATEIYSQTQFPTCSAASSCIQIGRCISLRDKNDWRTVGVTCGYGSGKLRKVCCPRRPPTARPPKAPRRNADCGYKRPVRHLTNQPLVMGGRNATDGDWPWMVAIRIREPYGSSTPWCTGFLIDRRHVLSAAHCFNKRKESLYSTRIGRVNQDEADEYGITRIIIPENYKTEYYYNDIAILKLSREVKDPNIVPICLPDEQLMNMDLTGMGTTVAGWGAEGPDNQQMSRILKELHGIPVVPNSQCNRIFTVQPSLRRHLPRGLTSGFLCAGFPEGLRDSCQGDSGGPLMFRDKSRWFAVGIVAFGYSCGEPGIPAAYTRVSSYMNWIRQNN